MLPLTLGLSAEQVGALNDDRVGRALDELFDCDRQLLLTDVVLRMVQEFRIRLEELHNESTSLTFRRLCRSGWPKDCRPDLKQLLWILTVSSDGGVPVHFKVDHGNV